MGKTRKPIKQELKVLSLRLAQANPFRSRLNSPSPSARDAASGANGLDVGRATSAPSHRNSPAGAAERGSLPSHPLESSGTSNARPRSELPSQKAVPPIVINNGLAGEGGEILNLQDPGPRSQNQEWVSLSFLQYLN